MPKFKVMDRVIRPDKGKGTVIGFDTAKLVLVEYDDWTEGHDGNGCCDRPINPKRNSCWYEVPECIKLFQLEPMNYKIRVTPAESEAIQKCCFEMGFTDWAGDKDVDDIDRPWLWVTETESSPGRYCWRMTHDEYSGVEISPKDFLAKYSKSKPDPAHDIGGLSRSTYTGLETCVDTESGTLTIEKLKGLRDKLSESESDDDRYLYYFDPCQFVWLQKPETVQTKKKGGLMSTVSKLAAKLLDADLRTLIKAGYLDSELNLTHEGQRALLIVLFQQKEVKAELVKAAKEDIKARKEECDCDE